MKTEIRLCHLYPDLLNLYGDRGNILALQRRAEWRGIPFSTTGASLGDAFDPGAYNLVFLGGGQDAEQNILRQDFVEKKGGDIKKAVEAGVVFLCVCGGYQMMGKYYEEHDGRRLDCLGAINVWTIGRKERFIGNTSYSCDLLPENKKDLYGFENHSGRTYLGENVRPLATVTEGAGNNGEDKTEGAVYKNVYCTYSHGSFLPKNPAMTDFLLEKAIRADILREMSKSGKSDAAGRFTSEKEFSLSPLPDDVEEIARKTSPAYKSLIDR